MMQSLLGEEPRDVADQPVERRAFAIFVLVLCATHTEISQGVRICAGLLVLWGTAFPRHLGRAETWGLLAWILGLDLVLHFDSAANHYWLTVYTSAALAISLPPTPSTNQLVSERNPLNLFRALLFSVFFFATLHKLFSPYFLSGRLMAELILGGHSLFNVLSWWIPGHPEIVMDYHQTMAAASDELPRSEVRTALGAPGAQLLQVCRILSLSIVLLELAMVLALAMDRFFYHRGMVGVLLAFVWSTFIFRGEFAFFSLVCILFLLAKPTLDQRGKMSFLVSIGLFLAFELAGV